MVKTPKITVLKIYVYYNERSLRVNSRALFYLSRQVGSAILKVPLLNYLLIKKNVINICRLI